MQIIGKKMGVGALGAYLSVSFLRSCPWWCSPSWTAASSGPSSSRPGSSCSTPATAPGSSSKLKKSRWFNGTERFLLLLFFTPIPRTYTSLPLDGMARNDLLSTWICKITQYIRSGSIFCLHHYTQGEKKSHLIWAGVKPRSSCLTSNRSNH